MAPKRPLDPARILWRASRIVRNRWFRGWYAATEFGARVSPVAYGARSFCVLGALRKAAEVEARRLGMPVLVKGRSTYPGARGSDGWKPVPERDGPQRLEAHSACENETAERLYVVAHARAYEGVASFNDAQTNPACVAEFVLAGIRRPAPVATRQDERD